MEPRLRSRDRARAPYPLNRFPSNFALSVGRGIIYLLATKAQPSLEGTEWGKYSQMLLMVNGNQPTLA